MFGCSSGKGRERKRGREGTERRKYFLMMFIDIGKKR